MNQWGRPSYFPPQTMQPYDYLPHNDANQGMNLPWQGYSQMQQQAASPFDYFAKPPQAMPWGNQLPPMGTTNSTNPWSQQSKGFLTYFQDKNGQLDIDKMLYTVGQMANTFQQVSPLFKQLGTFVKGIK